MMRFEATIHGAAVFEDDVGREIRIVGRRLTRRAFGHQSWRRNLGNAQMVDMYSRS